jgi:hypothetical protein
MFDGLFEELKDIVLYIIDVIWLFFFDENNGIVWWIIDLMFSYGELFLLQLVEVFGMEDLLSEYSEVISETMMICSEIDRFVPLHESLELFFIFLSFLTILLTIKMILKLIPGIG